MTRGNTQDVRHSLSEGLADLSASNLLGRPGATQYPQKLFIAQISGADPRAVVPPSAQEEKLFAQFFVGAVIEQACRNTLDMGHERSPSPAASRSFAYGQQPAAALMKSVLAVEEHAKNLASRKHSVGRENHEFAGGLAA